MSTPTFPIRAAAALFLERQQLDRPRGRRLTAANLTRFAEEVCGIQLDSINVVDRAHYLTLWSRFGAYDRRKLDRLCYRDRVLFEYWAHVACLVPTTDFPAWRRAMLDYQMRHSGWSFLRKHRATLEHVEALIRERGPLGSKDFLDEKPRKRSAGWWSWKPAAHAMDYLWKSGRLGVHSRVHFHRRLDLMERMLPHALEQPPPTSEEFRRWHVRRSLHAMGAATETDLRLYMTFPRVDVTERRYHLREMVRSGEVAEVALEGDRARWFALAKDLPALAAAGRKRAPSRGATLLAPFDSFLWHRERTRKLFGYDYRIEVYTPGHKRTFGYYALPLFLDGHLIGKADTKNHREEGRLEVRNVHFEPWVFSGKAPPAAAWRRITLDDGIGGLAESLRSLAEFLGLSRITVTSPTPAKLAAPLRRALDAVAVESA